MSHRRIITAALALGTLLFAGCANETSCNTNKDCAGGVCVAGKCDAAPSESRCGTGVAACTADGECGFGRCVDTCCDDSCTSNLDCRQDGECRGGVCRAPDEKPAGCVQNADCTAAGRPKCKIGTGECVPCLADLDCGDVIMRCTTANQCEVAAGRCRANTDCASLSLTKRCDTGAKVCVQCLNTLDCDANELCERARCVPKPSGCGSDSECTATPATPHCLNATRACVACTTDTHCSTDGSKRCDTGTHACVDVPPPGCGNDAACATDPGGRRCRITDRTCVRCLQNQDCGAGERCLADNSCAPPGRCSSGIDCAPPTGVCRTADKTCVECTAHADCGTGRQCAENLCVATTGGCASDAQCGGSTPLCRTSDRTCVACRVREDCAPLNTCTAGACVSAPCVSDTECARANTAKPYCPSSGVCAQCTTDAQCGTGNVCRAGTCAQGGCASDADCTATLTAPRCRTSDRVCVPCTTDAHCGTGKKCQANACVDAGCATNADCTADATKKLCKAATGACVSCLANTDCATGYRCDQNACAPTPGLGTSCTTALCPNGLFCISNATSDVCRAPCDLYAVNPGCPADERCSRVGFDAAGRPEGACVPARTGGAVAGGVCSSTTLCDYGLTCVYDSPTAGKCRKYCDPATSAGCASPNKCQRLVRLDDNDVPRTFGACFPDTRYLDPCTTTSQCDTGQICQAGPDPQAPTTARNLCDWPWGTKAGMAPCATDSECQSGTCLSGVPNTWGRDAQGVLPTGYCQQACSTDTQCTTQNGKAGACGMAEYLWFNAAGDLATLGVPSCIVQCTGETNCTSNDSCINEANATRTAWLNRCKPGNTTNRWAWGGSACDQDTDCWSGKCLRYGSATDGICLGTCDITDATAASIECDVPSECAPYGVLEGLPGPDGVWGNTDDKVANRGICWGRRCLKDGDCAGQSLDSSKPRVCQADPDPRNTADLMLVCAPRIGAKRGGDLCTTDAECGSNWCVEWRDTRVGHNSTSKRCFGACQALSDCTSATSAVACVTLRWSSSATRDTKVCVPVF